MGHYGYYLMPDLTRTQFELFIMEYVERWDSTDGEIAEAWSQQHPDFARCRKTVCDTRRRLQKEGKERAIEMAKQKMLDVTERLYEMATADWRDAVEFQAGQPVIKDLDALTPGQAAALRVKVTGGKGKVWRGELSSNPAHHMQAAKEFLTYTTGTQFDDVANACIGALAKAGQKVAVARIVDGEDPLIVLLSVARFPGEEEEQE